MENYKRNCFFKTQTNSCYHLTLLVDGRSITNPKDNAESFNNYFFSISQELQKKIPPTKQKPGNYLKKDSK